MIAGGLLLLLLLAGGSSPVGCRAAGDEAKKDPHAAGWNVYAGVARGWDILRGWAIYEGPARPPPPPERRGAAGEPPAPGTAQAAGFAAGSKPGDEPAASAALKYAS